MCYLLIFLFIFPLTGEPGKLIRERYRTASQVVQNQVRSFIAFITGICICLYVWVLLFYIGYVMIYVICYDLLAVLVLTHIYSFSCFLVSVTSMIYCWLLSKMLTKFQMDICDQYESSRYCRRHIPSFVPQYLSLSYMKKKQKCTMHAHAHPFTHPQFSIERQIKIENNKNKTSMIFHAFENVYLFHWKKSSFTA